ncbi:MAG: hypothetical protein R6V46_16450 [Desulfatiglandaceae bacterium]
MKKKPLLSILRRKTEQELKVKLRVYKFQGTLVREFSSLEQAGEFANSEAKKYPGILFKPYLEKRNSGDRREVLDRRGGRDRRNTSDRRSVSKRNDTHSLTGSHKRK